MKISDVEQKTMNASILVTDTVVRTGMFYHDIRNDVVQITYDATAAVDRVALWETSIVAHELKVKLLS